jgi:PAS domain S-box-containing protein
VRLEGHTRIRLCGLAAAIVAAAVGALWWFGVRRPPLPKRTLRIGYEHNPPYQVAHASGSPTGLVVDTVREAARRAGIPLEWTESRLGPERALGTEAVDLWPLVTDLPDRRKVMYISAPWLQSQHVLVLRAGTPLPGRDFAGSVSITAVALHVRLLHEHFPHANAKERPEGADALAPLCAGEVEGAFLESRLALAVLRKRPPPCESLDLHAHLLPGTHDLGVGSTFAAAAAADQIRDEISELARDGTLAVLMAQYSFFGLADTRATYDLLVAQERNRRLLLVIAGLSLALGLTLWLAWSVRAARNAERQARRAESEMLGRYEVASRAASDAIWELDLARRRVKWSAAIATLVGGSMPDLETDLRWCEEHVHPEDRERLRAKAEDHIARGEDKLEEELRFLRADGSYARVIVRAYVVRDAAGRPQRMIGAIVDVTRRRELEEELLQAHKMEAVGRLAGGVAHDFNNLLTAIIGSTALAARRTAGDERLARYLREIGGAADRAAALTTQLLAFSRRQVLHPEVVSLNAVVAEVESLLRRLIGEHIELQVSLAGELGHVRIDKGQIGQVLINLCLNGRDAMPRGGRLVVETSAVEWRDGDPGRPPELGPGPHVVLSVSDEGSGMDTETLHHLFEPFFTTKARGKGTGLGLSSSHGIVRQSGGHIGVESRVGKGTTFRVYLPRVASPPAAADPQAFDASAATPEGAETILIAEDDGSVRRLAAEVLREHGFTVHEAGSGFEALRVCRDSAADIALLVTDVVMPDLSGPEVAARVRSVRPATKVLYMSGYAGGAILDDLRRDGCVLLSKPFTPDAILRAVRDAIAGS